MSVHLTPPIPADKVRVGRRPKGSVDARQQLVTAAIACLGKVGARGATGRAVCREAGVSHALLAHYFADLDDLLLEAYKHLCDRFLRGFVSTLAQHQGDPLSGVEAVFAMQFSPAWASPAFLGAWMGFWHLALDHPAFARINEAHNASLRQLLAAAVDRLARPKRTRIDADMVALTLLATMDGLWLELCLRPDDRKRGDAVALCLRTLRALLSPPPDPGLDKAAPTPTI